VCYFVLLALGYLAKFLSVVSTLKYPPTMKQSMFVSRMAMWADMVIALGESNTFVSLLRSSASAHCWLRVDCFGLHARLLVLLPLYY